MLFLRCFVFFLIYARASRASRVHFKEWYPLYEPVLRAAIEGPCAEYYELYLTEVAPSSNKSKIVVPVEDCILDNLRQSILSDMAASAVLLGLLPTTLGLLGSTTTEVGVLALRRPLLAFLTAAGAPAPSPLRPFEWWNFEDLIGKRVKARKAHHPGPTGRWIVVVVEYLAAFAAIVNLALVSYDLGIKTNCSLSPETSFLPALYAFLAVLLHLFGTLTVYLRANLSSRKTVATGFLESLKKMLRAEFRPLVAHEQLRFYIKEETLVSIIASWLASTFTVFHIIYGTAIFSSILFIGSSDALGVVIRYIASTIICRLIVMYELSGLREALENKESSGESTYQELVTRQAK